jgi:hypothetical protein
MVGMVSDPVRLPLQGGLPPVDDKEYFLVTRIVDLFLAEPSYAAGTRLTRDHRPADGAGWSPAGSGGSGASPARVSPLAGLVTVDSRDDPRVQVADLLAGAARRLPGTVGDGPLRPFLSPTSLCDPGR